MKTMLENALQALVTAGWVNGSSGSVDAPMGLLSVIDATTEREMLAEVLGDAGIDWPPTLRRCWYVVRQNAHGDIEQVSVSETGAQVVLRAHQEQFSQWVAEQGDGSTAPPADVYARVSDMARRGRFNAIISAGIEQALEELRNPEITPGQRRGNALWVLEDTSDTLRALA